MKSEVNTLTDYLTSSSQLPPYLAYPRFLLDMDISETAKLVYAVLLDRASCPCKMRAGQIKPVMCSSISPSPILPQRSIKAK